MIYRELEPNEKPDEKLHDEAICGNGAWVETAFQGERTVQSIIDECRAFGQPFEAKYRRPIEATPQRTSEVRGCEK